LALTVFLAELALVSILTLHQKPIYRAEALIEIQKENPDIVTVQDLFVMEAASDPYLQGQYNVLRSRTLARRVIEELKLNEREEFTRPRGIMRKPLTFQDRLEIAPVRSSRLARIRFEAEDPALSAAVVNRLIAHYVEQSLEMRLAATEAASIWLVEQIAEVQKKLEVSAERLRQFESQHKLAILEGAKGDETNLAHKRLLQLQDDWTEAEQERIKKESAFQTVSEGNADLRPFLAQEEGIGQLQLRLDDLRREQARLLEKFGPQFPAVKQGAKQIEETQTSLEQERERAVKRVINEYRAAVRREQMLRQAYEEQKELTNSLVEHAVQHNVLRRDVETHQRLYDGLLQRLQEARVSAGLKASSVRIVDSADPPQEPIRPNVPANLLFASVTGVLLALGAALLSAHLDDTLRDPQDAERVIHAPSLAVVPSWNVLEARSDHVRREKLRFVSGGMGLKLREGALVRDAGAEINSLPNQLIEAFRNLRTSVLLSTSHGAPRSILVTSAQPNEGKTMVSINLAVSLAQLGWRVLLVEADMRRPRISLVFGVHESPGLVSYLTGQRHWRASVLSTKHENLDILVSGQIPPNPAELLSTDRIQELIHAAREEYRVVLVDSPMILNLADSRVLSPLVDGVILVVRSGRTRRTLVRTACTHLRNVGANLLGVVLNDVNVSVDREYYSTFYGYLRKDVVIESEK